MKIVIIGAGYVGLTVGTCLAHLGHEVSCIEKNKQKLDLLQKGQCPIYEPRLGEILADVVASKKITFYDSLELLKGKIDCYFIAVGTPSAADGSADLSYIEDAVSTLVAHLKANTKIIMKSTVPIGTAKKLQLQFQSLLAAKGLHCDYISNPEFLKEGVAVDDFLKPDRIVVGTDNPDCFEFMKKLYAPLEVTSERYIEVSPTDAELIKYAANAFLATKISFINEISRVADRFDANIKNVAKGIGSDTRISPHFLRAGCGYGGSCFPKDVDELVMLGAKNDLHLSLLNAVKQVNAEQKYRPFKLLKQAFANNNLSGKTIAVWGVSFKPDTDDIRDAPALTFIRQAVNLQCRVRICDPVALPNLKRWLADNELSQFVHCRLDPYAVLEQADALVLMTEWSYFTEPDWNKVAALLQHKIIIDGRNLYADSRAELKANGFNYHGIGLR